MKNKINIKELRKNQLNVNKAALKKYLSLLNKEETTETPYEIAYSLLRHTAYIEKLSNSSLPPASRTGRYNASIPCLSKQALKIAGLNE